MAPADRIRALLASEAAAVRLDDAEFNELQELLGALTPEERERERDSMDEAAALAMAAFLAEDLGAWRRMPDDLRGRLLAMGRARAVDLPPRRANRPARWGWAAAGAMALVWLVTIVMPQRPQLPEPVSAHSAPDAVTLAWRSEIGSYEQVQGDVTWSDSLQIGEMRFSGLPASDPGEMQYQLWIVDPDRYANPVDGGVFDADGTGELVVAVDAKLPVEAPVAFAVSLEQAGGVVVSDGPLLLVAAAGQRPDGSL